MAKGDKLESYRRKRDFERTAEPAGGAGDPKEAAPPRFVVQEHHATRLHWDLRLEHDATLASWAVPNGIPTTPKENRLAVRTEDHPLEYLDFHGQIPAGEYGAGSMTIWDSGTYELEKWRDNEVMAVFHGEKMRGRYVLIRTRDKDWLLHRMDPPEDPDFQPLPERMVPMLATRGELPPDDEPGWAFEIAWNGVRALCFSKPGRIRLAGRSGAGLTPRFPELRPLNRAFGSHEALLDGEIVCFGEDGRPDPELLARRMAPFPSEAALRRAARDRPATYVIYDCLHLDGHSQLERGYEERRAALDAIERLAEHQSARVPRHHAGDGSALLAAAREQGLHGVVGKRLDEPYTPGRPGWRLVAIDDPEPPVDFEPLEIPAAPDYYARISIWILPHLRGAEPAIDDATVSAPCAPDLLAWDLPAELAPVLAGMLEHLGLRQFTRTIGDGDVQVAAPLNSDTKPAKVESFANAVVGTLDQAGPGARWSGETTIAPYSLCKDGTVSVPLEPDEEPREFTPDEAIERVERAGDPWAPALYVRQELP